MIINKNVHYFLIPREAVKTMLIFKQMLFTYLNLHQHFGQPVTFTPAHPLPFVNSLPNNVTHINASKDGNKNEYVPTCDHLG